MEEEHFSIDSKKEDIESTFKSWLIESRSYHDALDKARELTHQYYVGEQTSKGRVPAYNSNIVENRVFESIETIVPIVTANAHSFLVLPASDNEKSVDKANKLGKVLDRKYQTLEMQRKLEEVTRDILLKRFGVMKWVWDEVLDDVDIKVIDPKNIFIPKLKVPANDLYYKIELQEYTKAEMLEYFPKIKIDEFMPSSTPETREPQRFGKSYKVYEVWTNEMVAWFCNDQMLEKKPNPYWDFEGTEKTKREPGKKRSTKELVYKNHLDRPTDPYVFFSTFNPGGDPVADISLVEVAIPLADAINVEKRKIIDNLRRLGNGQVYVDDDAMSQELADNITDEVGLIIRGQGVASQNKVRREPGVPLPSGHFEDLLHSENTFDNLMGVHAVTRGASGQKTLGQDIISRQQDYTRVDLLTRVLNRGVARLANGLVQLMKLYYTAPKVIKILGEEGAVEFITLTQKDIEDHVEIFVKSGQNLPMDKVSLRTEAVQLWQLGALDPVTLFERLDQPNPAKQAERLILWKQGQLSADTIAKIQLAAAQAGMQPKPTPAPAGSTPAAGATPPAQGAEPRSVETPMNVMQRATANLGGTAPSLPATPNLTGEQKQ